MAVLPEINALVDLAHDGTEYLSRVENVAGHSVSIAAPLNGTLEPPEPGSAMSLRWSAGPRGRYSAGATLLSMRRPKGTGRQFWNLQVDGPAELDQRRAFVRAGGGEPVQLASRWGGSLAGEATDVGEGGVRCRFGYADLRVGEPVGVAVKLGPDLLAADGWVLRVIDDIPRRAVDVVVTYALAERDAVVVRRYVMQQQILARRAASGETS
jgi:hypothetical protein